MWASFLRHHPEEIFPVGLDFSDVAHAHVVPSPYSCVEISLNICMVNSGIIVHLLHCPNAMSFLLLLQMPSINPIPCSLFWAQVRPRLCHRQAVERGCTFGRSRPYLKVQTIDQEKNSFKAKQAIQNRFGQGLVCKLVIPSSRLSMVFVSMWFCCIQIEFELKC